MLVGREQEERTAEEDLHAYLDSSGDENKSSSFVR
jgi:hypothetical protein